MAEKRNIRRYPKRLQLRFGQDGPLHVAFTGDISTTGLFVKTTRPYPPATSLDIELITKDNSIINIKGVVMWAKTAPMSLSHLAKAGMGIKIARILTGQEIYKRLLD